jgi:hypothetical protein
MLPNDEAKTVEIVVGELTKMHRTFTGKNVVDRIFKKGLRHEIPIVKVCSTPEDVSGYVRHLFNTKSQVFSGYGSTIIQHDNGPVVYFPLPYHVKQAVKKIYSAITDSRGFLVNQPVDSNDPNPVL